MATLTQLWNDETKSRARAALPLAPVAADPAAVALSSSQRFSIGVAGDLFVVCASDYFHLVAGTSTIVATTSSPGAFPPGVYRFALPDSCTHVALIQASGATATGTAWKG